MYGLGANSVLAPTGCDGIDFTSWGGTAVRVYRDFSIIGTSTSANSGISTTTAPGACWFVNFYNIGIENFNQAAIYANGFRSCNWFGVGGFNNYCGVVLSGQNTGNKFVACSFIRGTIAGTGGAFGVLIEQSDALSSQSQQFLGCYWFGYDIGINQDFGFETQIDDCDVSNCLVTGVAVTGIEGGFWLNNSWIETNNTTVTTGLLVGALAVASPSAIHAENNRYNCDGLSAGSVGVYVPQNALQLVNVNGSELNGFATGIQAGSDHFSAKWCRFFGCTTTDILLDSAYSTNSDIGPNWTNGSAPLTFSSGTTVTPAGMRYEGPGMRGTKAFASSTSAAVTFTTPMPSSTYTVTLGGNAAGNSWAVSKATTGFTINCAGSNSNIEDWAVSYG
jgi:hypothetical protein